MTVTSRLLRPITLLFLLASVNLAPQFARGEWRAHHIRQGDGKGGWATRAVLEGAKDRYGLAPADVLLNCSHTTPPAVAVWVLSLSINVLA
jgi:hypothetical protein